MFDIKEIIKQARERGTTEFKRHAHYTNTDEGKYMVEFVGVTITSKKVNDWGREEDHDEFLGLDEKGWILYSHDIEHGAGVPKIKSSKEYPITDEDVYNYLESEKCRNKDFLQFMSKAYKVQF